MGKKIKDFNFSFSLLSFLLWRVFLFTVLWGAVRYLSLQDNFLGGGKETYQLNPYLWSWLNFDGEHYLSIAWQGYRDLQYFFFPLYPGVISFLTKVFSTSVKTHAIVGLMISNTSFLLGLIGLTKLIGFDYKENIAKISIILLLLFPTSFYFVSYYTESLFFALVVWSFVFARQKRWILAGILSSSAGVTKVIGLALIISLLIELLDQNSFFREKSLKKLIKSIRPPVFMGFLVMPIGIVSYMYYLYSKTGDALEFFNSVGIYGEQRSAGFVSFPRVIYRYLFKIVPNINYKSFSTVFVTWMELLSAVVFAGLVIWVIYKKIFKKKGISFRWSYVVYLTLGIIIPSFSGSFSSMPRYVLVLFPGFIAMSLLVSRLSKSVQLIVFGLLLIGLVIAESLFVRGYWVS